MRRISSWLALFCALLLAGMAGCGDPQPAINRVGVNIVEKSAFTGSWYMARVVVDMDYEAAGLSYIGESAGDDTGGFLGTVIPRIRWVIDERFLYAYRDYEIVGDTEDPTGTRGDEDPNYLGQPVAAFAIQSHFDIQRQYNAVTGEQWNVIEENTTDRPWYERQFMRVDWSRNMLTSYFGNSHNLSEIFGEVRREPAALFIQDESQFPEEWRPQFHFMSCNDASDTSDSCQVDDRDWAGDYAPGTLYSMSFVTQELASPGTIFFPGFGVFPYCGEASQGLPECASVVLTIRTSFLRVSDTRQYEPVSWTHERFDRAGYFALDRTTYDRSSAAGDPSFGRTDFTNQSANRHNIWRQWYTEDADGNRTAIPYADRDVRPIVWHTSRELPAHLVRPSFGFVSEWNEVLMHTVRELRGVPNPVYADVPCQSDNPGGYCYCQPHPDTGEILNPTCSGRYDPFARPGEQEVTSGTPYDCWVNVPAGAEPDMNDPSVAGTLTDADFNGWYGATMEGSECVNILRVNTCNLAAVAANGGNSNGMTCQERGDIRYKFVSFVEQPGTPFLGVAQMRGDPVTGELFTGDANIGGPAMNSQRTRALQAYDLMAGNTSEVEFYTGEDVRAYLESLNAVQQPADPRIDFLTALQGLDGVEFDVASQGDMDNLMARAMERADLLRGPDARARIFSDRVRTLAGTDTERRLFANEELTVMAGMNNIPTGMNVADVSEELLGMASPFRNGLSERLDQIQDFQMRLGLANMIMPTDYTDDSVLWFVNQHLDWPRARIEIELNRRLYSETEVHEMGHCLGLRHSFGGTADVNNYADGYYIINERFPLPQAEDFNTDGTPGLSVDEQVRYEDAYREARRLRELSGIDTWMNASVMDYTSNWYERISGASRYDLMAISMGYGDLVDIYHNTAGRPVEQVNPVNTPRVSIKYYTGGQACTTDADCDFNPAGARSGELLQANTASGLVQRCAPVDRTPGANACTSFDEDAAALIDSGAANEWIPVEYFYCEDYRAYTRTLPGCAIFDEGDSFREIVANQAEAYNRDYIFSAFRRYRRGFSIGGYFGRLLRYLDPLIAIYTNLVYRYSTDPEFRTQEGPFGFYDEFMATADIFNFFARMLSQPEVGGYVWNRGWERYEREYRDPDNSAANLPVDIGLGRFLRSIYQTGLTGIDRLERVGSIYDQLLALQLLTIRGLGPFYGPDLVFLTNFYDLFPNEVQQLFSGIIAGTPEEFMPRVMCEGAFPDCDNARLVFMNFYRGDCSEDGVAAGRCRPNPREVYGGDELRLLDSSSFFIQNLALIYALSDFPVYYDTTFQNQMFICVEGQGECFAPDDGAVEGVDYIRYTSVRFGKSFLAWRVESRVGAGDQDSIAFSMVREAANASFIVRMLQKYRGDFGGVPFDIGNLTAAERAQLAAIPYASPDTISSTEVSNEIDRLDDRVRSLESFFNLIIQTQTEFGIQFPFPYRRPEL